MLRKTMTLFAAVGALLTIPGIASANPSNSNSTDIGNSGWYLVAVDNPTPSPTGFFASSVVASHNGSKTWNQTAIEVQRLVGGVWRGLTWTYWVNPAPGHAYWNARTDTKTPNAAPILTLKPGMQFRTWAWGYVMAPDHKWQAAAVTSPVYTVPATEPNGQSAKIGTSGWTLTAVGNPTSPRPQALYGYYGSAIVQSGNGSETWNQTAIEVQQLVNGAWRAVPRTYWVNPAVGQAYWTSRSSTLTANIWPIVTLSPGMKVRTWAWAYVMAPDNKWQATTVVSPVYTVP